MCAPIAAAEPAADSSAAFVKALDKMMVELAPSNARAAATVRAEYRAHLDLLVLDRYNALEEALSTGGLVPLPQHVERFNLKVRVDGHSPIGERDLANQASYISARPATIGALIDIASRVKSGPLEITSLVRHTEYQESLKTSNVNANTSIPMHTMGLAVDIALVNTPLTRVYEIRDVLKRMQQAGDILFIGERKQLVFHVVPHPSRLGHFTEVYARAMAAAAAGEIIPSAPVPHVLSPLAEAVVNTEVVSIRPTDDFAAQWWASSNAPSDLTVAVSARSYAALASPVEPHSRLSRWTNIARRFVTGLFEGARGWLR